jgi:hypothetical protein
MEERVCLSPLLFHVLAKETKAQALRFIHSLAPNSHPESAKLLMCNPQQIRRSKYGFAKYS